MSRIENFRTFEAKGDHFPKDDPTLEKLNFLISDIEDIVDNVEMWGYESFTTGYDEYRIMITSKAKFGVYEAYEQEHGRDFTDIDRSIEMYIEVYEEMKKFTNRVIDDLGLILNYFYIESKPNGHKNIHTGISFFRPR